MGSSVKKQRKEVRERDFGEWRISLRDAFSRIPDPRDKRGRRYRLDDILIPAPIRGPSANCSDMQGKPVKQLIHGVLCQSRCEILFKRLSWRGNPSLDYLLGYEYSCNTSME